MHMPAQIQRKPAKVVEIEPESDGPGLEIDALGVLDRVVQHKHRPAMVVDPTVDPVSQRTTTAASQWCQNGTIVVSQWCCSGAVCQHPLVKISLSTKITALSKSLLVPKI